MKGGDILSYTPTEKAEHIRQLQLMLRTISFADENVPRIVPDGFYGSATAEAVKAFQQAYGLPVTGETDFATWQELRRRSQTAAVYHKRPTKINPFGSAVNVIRKGDKSPAAAIIQAMLCAVSEKYPNIGKITVNGCFDSPSEIALRRFQKLCGLPPTGEADIFTWNCLARFFNSLNEH